MQNMIQEQGVDTRHRLYESLSILEYDPLNEELNIGSHKSDCTDFHMKIPASSCADIVLYYFKLCSNKARREDKQD